MISKKRLTKIKRLKKRRKQFEDYIKFTKERIEIMDKKLFSLLIGRR